MQIENVHISLYDSNMKITVYSTETCPYCVRLKDWLDKKSIKYDSYDIEHNPVAAQNMYRISKQEYVPFSTIEFDDGKVVNVLGFDKESFEKALKNS